MRITKEEQQQRRERIIYAAFTLFCEKGIDRVKMSEIARAAKVSDISVYRYFETKVDLAMETIGVLWHEIIAEMTRHIGEDYPAKSGFEQLRILLDGFEYLFEQKLNFVIFSYDYKLYLIRHMVSMSEGGVANVLGPLQEKYIAALEKGISDGSVRPLGTAEDMYWAIWGLMRGYVAKIAIYDNMYAGENMWKSRFQLARTMLETALRSDSEQGSLPAG